MRIAINLTAVIKGMTGPLVYSQGFLSALAALDSDDEFMVYSSPDVRQLFEKDLGGNIKWHLVNFRNKVWQRVAWEQLMLPMHLLKWHADVLFAAFDLSPLFSPCPIVLGIRNPSPIRIPTGIRVKARIHRIISNYSCRRARFVFYPTKYAAKLLGDALNVKIGKRRIIPHGTDHKLWGSCEDDQSILEMYGVAARHYILFVSNLYPYKQPDLLINAFSVWLSKYKRNGYKLLLAGAAPKIYEKFGIQLRQLTDDLLMQESVIFAGNVPREHLPILYKRAAIFVLPTTIETFGHPFVEAMACGAPIICMDNEFSREICGEAAYYVSNSDVEMLVDAIDNVLSHDLLRTQMHQDGKERAKQFSWEREAQETLNLLRQATRNMDQAHNQSHPVKPNV